MKIAPRYLRRIIREELALLFEKVDTAEGETVTRAGDPYEYKSEGGTWFTRTKGSSDTWNSLAGSRYASTRSTLDSEFNVTPASSSSSSSSGSSSSSSDRPAIGSRGGAEGGPGADGEVEARNNTIALLMDPNNSRLQGSQGKAVFDRIWSRRARPHAVKLPDALEESISRAVQEHIGSEDVSRPRRAEGAIFLVAAVDEQDGNKSSQVYALVPTRRGRRDGQGRCPSRGNPCLGMWPVPEGVMNIIAQGVEAANLDRNFYYGTIQIT